MSGVIEGFRWALLDPDLPAPIPSVAISVVITALVLAGGLAYFRRTERTFADIV